MAAITAHEAPGRPARTRTAAGPLARGHARQGTRPRLTSVRTLADVVRGVLGAALLASSDDTLDEAGVLRTAVAQQRRTPRAA